jgi:signal transduction histidine kinase
MNRMIDDLLDVANIERGRLSLELDAREPAELVLRAIHMFDFESREHGIRLETALPTNLPLVRADAARIVQVLANLLRNAIKFTPEGGEIRVSVERKDSSVVFSVRDSGRGISTEDQRHIFDRYWQSAAGARTRGTGLGLSIAQGIVQAHGGRIWVESTLGSGSTFAFTIPSAN